MEFTSWYKPRWVIAISCFIATLSFSYAASQHFYYAKRLQGANRDKYNHDIINAELPVTKLIDFQGNLQSDDELRQGQVILVLLSSECSVCLEEGEQLKEIIGRHENLKFYGALLFWSDNNIHQIVDKFPLKVFLDHDSSLRKALGVKAVPIKIYLEDGVVKKVWTGGLINPKTKNTFIKDLEDIPVNITSTK